MNWVKNNIENKLCIICGKSAEWVLKPGLFGVCAYHKGCMTDEKPVGILTELLEYNKPRNTEERMQSKLKGCQLTKNVYESIKKEGLKNPLVVEPRDSGRFGVLLGSNRLVSLKELKYAIVPCIIVADNDLKRLKRFLKTYEKVN